MPTPNLSLEVISGPLDGQEITLKSPTEWGRAGDGELSFPWIDELGTPQARFNVEEETWWIEPVSGERSTRYNGERLEERVALEAGGFVQAGRGLLFITGIE